jgi:hypothetical protein
MSSDQFDRLRQEEEEEEEEENNANDDYNNHERQQRQQRLASNYIPCPVCRHTIVTYLNVEPYPNATHISPQDEFGSKYTYIIAQLESLYHTRQQSGHMSTKASIICIDALSASFLQLAWSALFPWARTSLVHIEDDDHEHTYEHSAATVESERGPHEHASLPISTTPQLEIVLFTSVPYNHHRHFDTCNVVVIPFQLATWLQEIDTSETVDSYIKSVIMSPFQCTPTSVVLVSQLEYEPSASSSVVIV